MWPFLWRHRTALWRWPWLTAVCVAAAVAWGVAHSEPCSFKWRGGGGCALRLPYDQTWTGGLLWGGVSFVLVGGLLHTARRIVEHPSPGYDKG